MAETKAKAKATEVKETSKKPRIGVFVCHCGTNIAGSIDVKQVVEYAKTLPEVAHAEDYQYVCSTPGQKLIEKAIKEKNLTGTVVAACSPRLHEPTFRRATQEGGLNPFRFEMANIREQNAWVHMHDRDAATEKAKDAVRIAVAKAALLEDLTPKSVTVEKTALVVGAGIAGMQAALDLANAGIKTYLVEKLPSIGGRMSQLDKTFPTLDCSQCILTPKMVDVGRAPNINLMTYTEVEAVEGFIGNFDVTLRKKARGVLSTDEAEAKGIVGGGCNGCGDCEPVCPVIKPNPFEMGMKPRKAIYIYHPQVVPLLYTVDFDTCIKCGLCVTACGEKKAIDLEMKDELVKLKVGTAVLALGYDIFPVEKKREWGYQQFENVVTSLEFERLICASGPTGGHLIRPSDGKTPKRVAFVLCAGSRDNTGIGKPYCSRFCCMYSLKHAHQIIEKIPGVIPYILYMDIRSFGKMYEEFYYRIQDEGAKFIRGRVANILEDKETKGLHVYAEDTMLGRPIDSRGGHGGPRGRRPARGRHRPDQEALRGLLLPGRVAPRGTPEAEPLRYHDGRRLRGRGLPGTEGYPRHRGAGRRGCLCGIHPHPHRKGGARAILRPVHRGEVRGMRHVREPLPVLGPLAHRQGGRREGHAGDRGQVQGLRYLRRLLPGRCHLDAALCNPAGRCAN